MTISARKGQLAKTQDKTHGVLWSGIYHKDIRKDAKETSEQFRAKIETDLNKALTSRELFNQQ